MGCTRCQASTSGGVALGNRRTSRSAGGRSSRGTGRSKSRTVAKGTSKRTSRSKGKGGPRQSKGWDGPKAPKQVRGSNTKTRLEHPRDVPDEDGRAKDRRQTRPSQADKENGGRPERRSSTQRDGGVPRDGRSRDTRKDGAPEGKPRSDRARAPGPAAPDGPALGPDKMGDLRKAADDMVVGERTVVHPAARYGIVRGMTWTVILSALLFWLPVLGPATAGYVGGRKAGGPLRGIIAVAIPALVMAILLAAIAEGIGMVPSGVLSGTEIDLDGVTDLPVRAVPILGSLQKSVGVWVSSPPDIFFIMAAFAIVGGALSSLRSREEETVIEKVGIPLGELKERILNEEATRSRGPGVDTPSRWEPHPIIAGPAAAHDALNDMVEEIVHNVIDYFQDNDQVATTRSRTGRRSKKRISTGDGSIQYDDLMPCNAEDGPDVAPAQRANPRARTARATVSQRRANSQASQAAYVGDSDDWVVADTTLGRRPIRVVHSPSEARPSRKARPRARGTKAAGTGWSPGEASEGVDEGTGAVWLPEPEMHVERKRSGLLRRRQGQVVYDVPKGSTNAPQPTTDLSGPSGRMGTVVDDEAQDTHRMPPQRNFERLPIIGPIMSGVGMDGDGVPRSGKLRSIEEPSFHDTMEATSIAESAARELAEMARFEEGPDLLPEDDDAPLDARGATGVSTRIEAMGELAPEPGQEVVPKAERKPNVRSTARKVKHPTGVLKSRGRSKARHDLEEVEFEDDLAMTGVVVWDGKESDEEEDLFNPRRLVDEVPEDAVDGPGNEDEGLDGHHSHDSQDGSDSTEDWDAEEERIAALVREREEWDRL